MDVFFWAIDPRVAFWTRFEANFRVGGNQGPLFLNGLTSPRVPGQLHIFFNLRQKPRDRDSNDPHWLSMFIESAYARNQRVGTTRRQPFGRLAEEIVSSSRAA